MLKTMNGVTAATVRAFSVLFFDSCFVFAVLPFLVNSAILLCSALASSDAQSGSRVGENPSPPSVLLKSGQICGTTRHQNNVGHVL